MKTASGANNNRALRVFARAKRAPGDTNYGMDLTADVSHTNVITLQKDVNQMDRVSRGSIAPYDVSYDFTGMANMPATSGTQYRTITDLTKMAPENRSGSDISLVSLHDCKVRVEVGKQTVQTPWYFMTGGAPTTSRVGNDVDLYYHAPNGALDVSYALNTGSPHWRKVPSHNLKFQDLKNTRYLEFDVSANDISHVTLSSGRFPYVVDGVANEVVFRVQRALDHTGSNSEGSGTFDTFTVDSSNIAHFNPAKYASYANRTGWSTSTGTKKWKNTA